jgi:hypothetical protein
LRIIPELGQVIDIASLADNALFKPLTELGLCQYDSDRLIEHNIEDSTMWLGNKAELGEGLVFNLGQITEIETIEIWNYNKPGYTSRGISRADIEVLAEDGTWKTILQSASIQEAEGSADYDEPSILTFVPVKTQKVRLVNLVPFKDKGVIGLSEIRFHKPIGFEACNPEPPNHAAINPSEQTKLFWTRGKEAVVHDIYAGSTPESLQLLGRTAQTEASLSGLAAGTCFWRIDAVKADGTVTRGQIWSFAREEGRTWRNWSLDEFKENKSLDSSSNQSIELMDNAVWLETDGIRKGIVQLDGSSCMKASALNQKINAMTISLWIWVDGVQNPCTGLVFCRGNSTVAGLNLSYFKKEPGYHWNGDPKTWGFDSGLGIPQKKWIFVAVAVKPSQATLYLYEDGKLKSASNTLHHNEEEFDAPLTFGDDPDATNDRHFKGKLDDIKIHNYCLTPQQIQALAENKPVELIQSGAVLSLVDTKLVDPQTDLKTIAKQLEAKQQEAQVQGKRSFWPGIAIVGVILAIVALTRIRKRH